MRFLLFGCNGMAGHMISLYLKEHGHTVIGFARKPSRLIDSIKGDATDLDLVKRSVGAGIYDSVINCVGILNQEAEDNKSNAVLLNSFFPHYLAELTKGTATQVIHISTDCVFSGMQGNYTEDDLRDGATFYDRSKALGELEDETNFTIRSSIVGPDINADGIGLLNWFMQRSEKTEGYVSAIWTGQTTLQLAKTVEAVAMRKAYGLYNMVPDESISKYDLLRLFNRHLRHGEVEIVPSMGVTTDKSLKRTKWTFDFRIPDYETMVIELGEWMRRHKELYPHYEL